MKRTIGISAICIALSISAFAQAGASAKQGPADKPVATAAAATGTGSADLAKTALTVHGGDRLKKMKTLVMKGSVDVTFMGQAIPGAFSMAISGDKYYFEITSPVQQMKQVYDGERMFSSLAPFSLPPITTVGFFVLSKVGDTGYVVGNLPEKSKKKGFRVTTPEGFYTDFFIDEKTGQVKGYESAFDVNGQVVTTAVDIDELQTLDGVVLPKKYAQRFDLGQVTAYATFKPKATLVNTAIDDSAFTVPK